MEMKGFHFLPVNSSFFSKFANGNKADLVHFQWLHNQFNYKTMLSTIYSSFSFFYQVIKLRRKGLSYCWTMHNMRPHENRRPLITFINYYLVSKMADAIVVMSEWQKNRVRKKFGVKDKKIFIIPHGNYIGYNINICTKEEARRILNIKGDKFVYLYFGQIRDYKGVSDLIENFKSIKKNGDLLVIAGRVKKDTVNDFSNLNGASIMPFLKWIAEDDIQYFFNAADVCVFPFKKIANSGSVLMAMSFGKPIICPSKGSCREIIKPNFGIRYDDGELGNAMRQVKKRDLNQMGKASYQEAEKYDWDNIADKFVDAFEFALKNKK